MTVLHPASIPTIEYLSTNLALAMVEVRHAAFLEDRARTLHARGQLGWHDFVVAKLDHADAVRKRDQWLKAFTDHRLEFAHMADDCLGCRAR